MGLYKKRTFFDLLSETRDYSREKVLRIFCMIILLLLLSSQKAEGLEEEWAARQIFAENCATCHGHDRVGFIGPGLTPSNLEELSQAAVRSLIKHGIYDTLMPAWNCRLNLKQLRLLSSYLKGTPPEIEKELSIKSDGSFEFLENSPWWEEPKRIEQGQTLFTEYCMGCHHPLIRAFAPTYKDVARQRDIQTMVGQIKFPYSSSKILGYREQIMPKFDLTDNEIKSLGAYIFTFGNQGKTEGP
jgi:mono/diheme cytochrome c family protein